MLFVFFFKQKTAYEMRISDWSSDVCSSDLAIRRLVVDKDAGRDAKRFGARARQRPRFQFRQQLLPIGERILDRTGQADDLPGLRKWPAERILDEEIVERQPVARRVDARVDYVAARQANAARDAIEQPRMVGGQYHPQRRAPIVVVHRGGGELHGARLQPLEQVRTVPPAPPRVTIGYRREPTV